MKFYYNGKLMRTSKNHIYTHAVVEEDKYLIGCRANKDSARSLITSEIFRLEQGIKNAEAHIKAMQRGDKMYKAIEGRRSYYMPIYKSDSIEDTEKYIESNKKRIEFIKENWKVVELEAK